jgi:hypothetical protein
MNPVSYQQPVENDMDRIDVHDLPEGSCAPALRINQIDLSRTLCVV